MRRKHNECFLFIKSPIRFGHNSMAHLRGNLIAYGVIVPLTYLLCLRTDRHKEFRVGFLAVLFVLPSIISVVSLVGPDFAVHSLLGVDPHVQSSRGFSTLDSAFIGMLIIADSLRSVSCWESSLWPSIGVLFCIGVASAFSGQSCRFGTCRSCWRFRRLLVGHNLDEHIMPKE